MLYPCSRAPVIPIHLLFAASLRISSGSFRRPAFKDRARTAGRALPVTQLHLFSFAIDCELFCLPTPFTASAIRRHEDSHGTQGDVHLPPFITSMFLFPNLFSPFIHSTSRLDTFVDSSATPFALLTSFSRPIRTPLTLPGRATVSSTECAVAIGARDGVQGFRMIRATHGVSSGSWYYEVKIKPPEKDTEKGHVRLGWCTEMGDVQVPLLRTLMGLDSNTPQSVRCCIHIIYPLL